MAELRGKLTEVFQLGCERAGILNLPAKFWPQPGQYLPCQNLSREAAILPTNLFNVMGSKGRLSLGPLPEAWIPGDMLAVLPPHGHGFHLPANARRVGLLAMGASPAHLLTLVEPALTQDAAITLFYFPTQPIEILDWLPPAVEVSPVASLLENLDWPDYLAMEVNLEDLDELSALFEGSRLPFPGQVLVRTAMPCRGLGKCGVCSVKTTRGWKLACQDGPVFPLEELIHVA